MVAVAKHRGRCPDNTRRVADLYATHSVFVVCFHAQLRRPEQLVGDPAAVDRIDLDLDQSMVYCLRLV